MKVTIPTVEAEKVFSAANDIAGKGYIDSMTKIRVTVDPEENKLIVAATNGNTAFDAVLPCRCEKGTEKITFLMSTKIVDILRNLPTETVILTIKPEEQNCIVQSGDKRSRMKVQISSADEYPALMTEAETKSTELEMPAALMKKIVKNVAFAAATDERKPILKGLHFKSDGDNLVVTASNGYVVAVSRFAIPANNSDINTVIPTETIAKLSKLLPDTEEVVTICSNDKGFVMSFGEEQKIRYGCKKLAGTFPDAELPYNNLRKIVIDTNNLLKTLGRAALGVSPQFRAPIVFNMTSCDVTSCLRSSLLEAFERIDMVSSEMVEPIKIAFDVNLLKEVVSRVKEEDCEIYLENGEKPVHIISTDEEVNLHYIICPVVI